MIAKKITIKLSLGVLLCVLSIILFPNMKTAHAASPSKYLALGSVNYIAELSNGDGYNEKIEYTSDGYLAEYFAVHISSKNPAESATAAKNSVFNFSEVTISAEIKKSTSPHNADFDFHHQSYLIKNMTTNRIIANGTLNGIGEVLFFSKTLIDGQYALQYVASGTRKDGGSGKITDYFTFAFYIDTIPPICTLKGDGTDITSGSYTNKLLTFSASDIRFDKLYYKKPNAEVFVEMMSTSYAVSPTIENNGLWQFYAEDTVGNFSEIYSVYIDTVKPIGEIYSGESILSNGIYINEAFEYKATDSGGVLEIQYKVPSDNTWRIYNGKQILPTFENGWYSFRAIDKAGQMSDELRICLDSENPAGSLFQSELDNSVYFTWEKDFWTATLDGQPYPKGTIITQEGDHMIILSSPTGASTEYEFSIEHHFLAIETIAPTCIDEGYTLHKCSNCGETYQDKIIDVMGHKYLETAVQGSCTKDSVLLFECERCDFEYSTITEVATGHKYESKMIKQATCTEEGERQHNCKLCHDSYIAVIPSIGHNYSITDIKTEDGKTHRTYTCKSCGDSYIQDLGNQNDKISSYVEYLFNQYSPYMAWVLIASSGVWSIVMGIMFMIAQRNEDKIKAKKMLLNYCLGLIVIFIILVACPYLVKGIAALLK